MTPPPSRTLIVDNGAHNLKLGYSTQDQPRCVFNGTVKTKHGSKRLLVADELDECTAPSGLFFVSPFQKGYTVNWSTQQQVWDRVFNDGLLAVQYKDTTLALSEPVMNFASCQQDTYELIFEQYEFAGLHMATAACWSMQHHVRTNENSAGCCLVVDAGHSFSHVVPFVNEQALGCAVKRCSVGGKLLTNQLKELISYRQLHVLEETYVINQCKEDTCFMSTQFNTDMDTVKNPKNELARKYLLPDFVDRNRGQVLPVTTETDINAQCIRMGVERFSVPELMLHPSDIGLNEAGLVQCAVDAVQLATKTCALTDENHDLHVPGRLLNNVVLTGGSTLFPAFAQRFESELRSCMPSVLSVQVHQSNPITFAWQGAKLWSQSDDFNQSVVSRKEYLEMGSPICRERFQQEVA